jgi:hypothetical protein
MLSRLFLEFPETNFAFCILQHLALTMAGMGHAHLMVP